MDYSHDTSNPIKKLRVKLVLANNYLGELLKIVLEINIALSQLRLFALIKALKVDW
jgi:hypothetical protein